jgi:hypothetical protein
MRKRNFGKSPYRGGLTRGGFVNDFGEFLALDLGKVFTAEL